MRRQLKPILYNAFNDNSRLFFITADLGYGFLDDIRKDFSSRLVVTGASEQLAMGIAIGLAEDNYVPIIYSITPFLLFRTAEWLRNYVNQEHLNVKLLASGRNHDYEVDGWTHFAGDDKNILSCFQNIKCFWPNDDNELNNDFYDFINCNSPAYLNLKR